MVSREVLATLVSIWPQIEEYLEDDLGNVKERLLRAGTMDEIRALQGRGLSLVALRNLPVTMAKDIHDAEEAYRQAEIQRMSQRAA